MITPWRSVGRGGRLLAPAASLGPRDPRIARPAGPARGAMVDPGSIKLVVRDLAPGLKSAEFLRASRRAVQ